MAKGTHAGLEGCVEVSTGQDSRVNYWRIAWICFLLAIPLRFMFFNGFGIADDVNDVHLARGIMVNGRLNPETAHHYRVGIHLPRVLSFKLFGFTELALILPVFLFAMLTYAASVLAAKDIFGKRGAFITSLLFLTTPFETLASTGNIHDYTNGFFAIACAWNCYVGYHRERPWRMVLAALMLVGGVATKVSGLGVVPVCGLACILSIRHWRRWVPFWLSLAFFIGCLCTADFFYSGKWFRWYYFNNFFHGYNASNKLWTVWAAFPKYVFWRDEYGHFMFGAAAWVAAAGILFALPGAVVKKSPQARFVLLCFVFLLLFNFMPHRLTLEGYYTHWRIYRYLALIVPMLYLPATYFFESLLQSNRWRAVRVTAWVLVFAVALSGIIGIPFVTRPPHNANKDHRALVKFLNENPPPKGSTVCAGQWHAMAISAFFKLGQHGLSLKSVPVAADERMIETIQSVEKGIVVTGGARMAWYGNPRMQVNLSKLDFEVPDTWELQQVFPGDKAPWREEPMQVWRVNP